MADQHLIMADHTMAHWPSELYLTGPVIDRENREAWIKRGGKELYGRACDEVERRLAAYRPIETDPAIDEAMRAIIRAGLVDQTELPRVPAAARAVDRRARCRGPSSQPAPRAGLTTPPP